MIDQSKLYSIEADTEQFKKATHFWELKKTNNKLKILNGTLHKDLPEFNNNDNLFVKQWYDAEKKMY